MFSMKNQNDKIVFNFYKVYVKKLTGLEEK